MVLKTLVLVASLVLIATPTKASGSQDGTMIEGIMTMRGNFKHVDLKLVEGLVKEVSEVVSKEEYIWIEPETILGLALNESDLRWWLVSGDKYFKDCGICQNHVPSFRNSFGARKKLCIDLTRSTKLSFEYAARELTDIYSKWCKDRYKAPIIREGEFIHNFLGRLEKYHLNKLRCTLNIYNQGPKYFSRIKDPKWYYRNNYWIRSYCFTMGIRLGKKPKVDCRRATSIRWVNSMYK